MRSRYGRTLEELVALVRSPGVFDGSNTKGRQPTSIRLAPTTRHFLENQAAALGTSVHSVIEMVLAGFIVTSRGETRRAAAPVTSRFLYLMHAHGLSLPDIVDVMARFGFSLSALGHTDRLLALLSNEALAYVAALFHVRLEWLAAGDQRALPDRTWTEAGFAAEVAAGWGEGLRPTVTLIRPTRRNATGDRVSAVVRREHLTPEGTEFVTLQVWPLERWRTDAPIREQVASLVAICRERGVPFAGVELPEQILQTLTLGDQLAVETLSCLPPRAWEVG